MTPVPLELPLRRKHLDQMAAIHGDPAVYPIAKAMAGRVNCRIRNPAQAKFVAEGLL